MNMSRIDRVLNALRGMNLTQMLVIDPISIYYLTGIRVEPLERFYALYIRTDGKHRFFLNRLFNVPECAGIKNVWYSDTDPVMEIAAGYMDHDVPLGVDKDLKARFLLPLIEMYAAKGFVNASLAVDLTRGIKDADEQQKMRKASEINDRAMAEFKKLIHEGVSEIEVAGQLLDIYLGLGADGFSFDPIVSFGANAADPHHMPDNTIIRDGDSVLFDVGCKKDDYCSDMTRTFYYKEVSDEHRKVYDTVLNANEAAIAKIRPGVPLKELDLAARDLIAANGYGECFTHRLGHFIGLSEHEYGDVSSVNERKAETGMIFSIEPGIYLSGDTGVRVEDLVLVTEDSREILNHYPKTLEIIG